MRSAIKELGIIFLAISMGCSGKDAGKDNIPPRVISVFPLAGASKVPVDVEISAKFSEKIKKESFDKNTFCLEGIGGIVGGEISFDDNTFTATLTPTSSLKKYSRYSAKLSSLITDMAGNNIEGGDYAWSFTTLPELDEKPPAFSGIERAYGDGEGRIKLEWTTAVDDVAETDEIEYLVCQSSQEGACIVSFETTYIAPAGSTNYSANDLQDEVKYCFVVRARDFAVNADKNSVEKCAMPDNSWIWKGAHAIHSWSHIPFGDHPIINEIVSDMDENGNIIVVWSDYFTPPEYHHGIFSKTYVPGSGWSSLNVVREAKYVSQYRYGESHEFVPAYNSFKFYEDGKGMLIYADILDYPENPRYSLMTARYSTAGGWEQAKEAPEYVCLTSCSDRNGNLINVCRLPRKVPEYYESDYISDEPDLRTQTIVASRYSESSGGWSDPEIISTMAEEGAVDPYGIYGPYLSCSNDGRAVVMWYLFDWIEAIPEEDSSLSIEYLYINVFDGMRWSGPTLIDEFEYVTPVTSLHWKQGLLFEDKNVVAIDRTGTAATCKYFPVTSPFHGCVARLSDGTFVETLEWWGHNINMDGDGNAMAVYGGGSDPQDLDHYGARISINRYTLSDGWGHEREEVKDGSMSGYKFMSFDANGGNTIIYTSFDDCESEEDFHRRFEEGEDYRILARRCPIRGGSCDKPVEIGKINKSQHPLFYDASSNYSGGIAAFWLVCDEETHRFGRPSRRDCSSEPVLLMTNILEIAR